MNRTVFQTGVGICALFLCHSVPVLGQSPVRFMAVDIYIESQQPIAAWQIQFSAQNGIVRIVGVENGDSDVFGDAPYYDRDAVGRGTSNRIIVADFSLHPKNELPRGRFRITTLHMVVNDAGVPVFDTQLVVATDFEGTRIHPTIRTQISSGSKQ